MGDLSKPLVSMIIPVFNAEKYVQNAIECVINQTYSNWELILVDNCSEDSTVDICKSWTKKDSRIKLLCHNENLGIGQSRTDGIQMARGDYILFMDSDDYIHPQMLETMVSYALEYDSSIVMCPYKNQRNGVFPVFESVETSISIERINKKEIIDRMYSDLIRTSTEFIYYPDISYLVIWNKLFKSEIAKRIKITFSGGEDAAFSFQAYNSVDDMIIVHSVPLYFFVDRYGSETRSSFSKLQISTVIVFYKMEQQLFEMKDIYSNHVALGTYETILWYKHESRKSSVIRTFNEVLKEYHPNFRKHFWKCKEISYYKKLIMDLYFYFPFLYRIRRHLIKMKHR